MSLLSDSEFSSSWSWVWLSSDFSLIQVGMPMPTGASDEEALGSADGAEEGADWASAGEVANAAVSTVAIVQRTQSFIEPRSIAESAAGILAASSLKPEFFGF